MKLLPLLLLICLDCGAQLPDKYDTVKVLLLVADTSRQYTTWPYFEIDTVKTKAYNDTAKGMYAMAIYGKEKNDTTFREPDYRTYWQFGYEVRERIGFILLGFSEPPPYENGYGYYYFRGYLDERRRPLSKSIIVWQSIKL